MEKQINRIHEVDGIRGWAALVVLLFHTFGEMLKFAVPNAHSSWLTPVLSGNIAVLVFFVLSGDALSSGYFSGGGYRVIDRLLVRRYFRLTIPILMSCLITYFIMFIGWDYHKEASVILQRPDWLGKYLQFKGSIYYFLRYSLIGVYVSHTIENSYNPFLWTMSIEMAGSMLVFLICYIWGRLRNPQFLCIGLIVFFTTIGSFFSLFFAGVLFGYFRKKGYLDKLLLQNQYQYFAFFIVLFIAAVLITSADIYPSAAIFPPKKIIAMILVFCFYTQRHLKYFFSNKLSQFLGEISFPLYLVHFQVLISLMSWLIVKDYSIKGVIDPDAMLKIGCITVAISLLVAWCFRYIERIVWKKVDFFVLKVLS